MDNKKLLGKRIKELRKRLNIRQEKLAELVGVEPTAISNIENGHNYPSIQTLEKIKDALDSTFNEIFRYEKHNDNKNLLDAIVKMLGENPDKIQDFYKIAKALVD